MRPPWNQWDQWNQRRLFSPTVHSLKRRRIEREDNLLHHDRVKLALGLGLWLNCRCLREQPSTSAARERSEGSRRRIRWHGKPRVGLVVNSLVAVGAWGSGVRANGGGPRRGRERMKWGQDEHNGRRWSAVGCRKGAVPRDSGCGVDPPYPHAHAHLRTDQARGALRGEDSHRLSDCVGAGVPGVMSCRTETVWTGEGRSVRAGVGGRPQPS